MKTFKVLGIISPILSLIGFFATEFFINLTEKQKLLIIIFFAILFVFGISLDIAMLSKKIIKWYKENTLPYPKRNKVGILISCEAAYDDAETFFSKSFIYEFKKLLQTENDLEVFVLPKKLKNKLKFNTEDIGNKTAKLLNSHNILLYLDYSLKSDGCIGKRHHVFFCNEFLIHQKVGKKLKDIIKTQLHEISIPIGKVSFLEEKNIEDMDKYNQALLLTSKYLISISLILYGDFLRARKMFYDIMSQKIEKRDTISALMKDIKEKASINYVTLRFIELCYLVENTNIVNYNFEISESLINEIAKYEAYLKTNYLSDFYTLRARHTFIRACKRKVDVDNKIINEIKEFNSKLSPRSVGKIVNDVFLLAIEDSSVSIIQKKLRRIEDLNVSQKYNFVHPIAFIEDVLLYYPKYKKLHIILAKYYEIEEQYVLSVECYKNCLDIICDTKEKEELLNQKQKIEGKL